MTTTDSTTDFVKAIVTRIRDYADANSRSVGTICDDRVFVSQAPDNADYPYVVLLIDTRTDPDTANIKERFELTATAYGRPRAKEQETELLAELILKALLTWRVSGASDGLVVVTSAQRNSDPPLDEPEDRDIVARGVIAEGYSYPLYLTSAVP